MVLLSTHYRQPLNWSVKPIEQAKKNLDRLYRIIKKSDSINYKQDADPSSSIIEALCDDLNTPEALGRFNILVNSLSDAPESEQGIILSKIKSSAQLLGILQEDPDKWLGYKTNNIGMDDALINSLIEERNKCRSEKDFKKADQIRDELKKNGIEIEDSSQGTTWRSVK